jgi:predicted GIY-YIG superfamily endonuclease
MIYELGHIYIIWDCEDHNLTYYGSTCDLNRRINEHKKQGNTCTAKQIIERGNYEVAILETYENIDKYDLVERERWYILNKPCVNKNIPNRTNAEWRQDNKQELADYYSEYYQNNKDKMLDVVKKYQEKNKEKLKQKFVCECGGKYTLAGKKQHEKSKKHQRYINITNQLH